MDNYLHRCTIPFILVENCKFFCGWPRIWRHQSHHQEELNKRVQIDLCLQRTQSWPSMAGIEERSSVNQDFIFALSSSIELTPKSKGANQCYTSLLSHKPSSLNTNWNSCLPKIYTGNFGSTLQPLVWVKLSEVKDS